MANTDVAGAIAPARGSKKSVLVGMLLALILAGGGFYATWSGLFFGHSEGEATTHEAQPIPDIAFVAIEPLVISLGPGAASKHLRFRAQLEVEKPEVDSVSLLVPRIVDVLNGYLRAVDTSQLEDPSALIRLRAHMLRRIQLVVGEGRVRDLLITEFVLN
ncbi:MAG: flagellar basal body-associated FliL family protein [Pseudorhodobacter sp.]|nr:flagellar basal body-associated FliL family protein [Pseudorhodobacter sp.]